MLRVEYEAALYRCDEPGRSPRGAIFLGDKDRELFRSTLSLGEAVWREVSLPAKPFHGTRNREQGPPGSFPIGTYSPLRKLPNSDTPATYDEHGAPPIATDAKMKKYHPIQFTVEMSGKTTEWWLM